METFFVGCLVIGGVVLVGQIALSIVGLGSGVEDVGGGKDVGSSGMAEGLEILSVRAIAAGVALFGVGGLGALAARLPSPLAVAAGLAAGLAGAAGTAWLTRQMLRLESDGSLRLENAVGAGGTVYLTIRPGVEGGGLVQFPLQGRTVEMRAITRGQEPIPTGAEVVVVAVVDQATVEVIANTSIEEELR